MMTNVINSAMKNGQPVLTVEEVGDLVLDTTGR